MVWVVYSSAYSPPFAISSAWVPLSVILPSAMEMIRPALRMVDSRWAMTSVVLPCARVSKARWIFASVTEYREKIDQYRIRIAGIFSKIWEMKK